MRFEWVFMRLGADFSHIFLLEKIFLGALENINTKQNRFRIVTIFFTFFYSIFLRHYVTYVPAGFGKVLLALILGCHGRIQRGGQGVRTPLPLLKNHKILGFLSNTGPDILKNHKATKPAFNFGPLSARQRNAI